MSVYMCVDVTFSCTYDKQTHHGITNTATITAYIPARSGADAGGYDTAREGRVSTDDEMARMDEWRYGVLSSKGRPSRWNG